MQDGGLADAGQDGGPPDAGLPSYFHATGSMSTARTGHTATVLPSGEVLVAGGYRRQATLDSAELYNAATGYFSITDSMRTPRANHTATMLPNGEVLIAGGNDLASAELYNPTTGTFSVTDSMRTVRDGHTATLLPNGKVLVAGGSNCDCAFGGCYSFASAELYDPATETFSGTDSMMTPRSNHTAVLLPSGEVLIAGGYNCTGCESDCILLASAELYNPATGSFSATETMGSPRAGHATTLLPNGKVLVAGGFDGYRSALASAELYNPATGTFSATDTMRTARAIHTATLLSSGKVLVAGAYNCDCAPWGCYSLASAELYDYTTETFGETGSMTVPRGIYTATLLPSDEVLVAGGHNCTGCGSICNFPLASAELFDEAMNSGESSN